MHSLAKNAASLASHEELVKSVSVAAPAIPLKINSKFNAHL
jgi:hypothetical protein